MKDGAENELRGLREMLSRLPDARVPSNFTARVMAEAEREDARSGRGWKASGWSWQGLMPRFAAATAALVLAGVVFHQHELQSRRDLMAESVARVAVAQPMPSVEALQNFDAIKRMGQPAHADEDLIALAPDLQ